MILAYYHRFVFFSNERYFVEFQEGGRVLKMHCGRECAYNEILKQVPMTSWGSKDLSVLTDEAWAARMVERFGSVISGDAEQVFESSF